MDLDPKITGSAEKISPLSFPASKVPEEQKTSGTPSGLSSIEDSKKAVPSNVPLPNLPLLILPHDQGSLSFSISSTAKGEMTVKFLEKIVGQQQAIIDKMLTDWSDNLKEIAQEVKERINSPLYQELQLLRTKGDPQFAFPSSAALQPVGQTAGTAAPQQVESILLTHNEVIERITPPEKGEKITETKDSAQVLVIPMAVAMLVAGGIGIAHIDPATKAVDLVEGLKSLVPAIQPSDIVPLINLLVVGPIYVQSWDEAISRFADKERTDYKQMAKRFSEDVVKMVADPTFILAHVVQKTERSGHLSGEDQSRLVIVLKLILCGVALSFLYAAEVGKVQGEKFGGLEPEEVKALLLGTFAPVEKEGEPLNEYQKATQRLMLHTQHQLSLLNPDERVIAVEQLLAYVSETKEIDAMLEPTTVFEKVLASMNFNPSRDGDYLKG